jgi:DNA polymerase III subunit delta'
MNDQSAFSRILVCKNSEKAKEYLQEKYGGMRHLWYEKEDFLLDDAKELIKEAYIAEVSTKYLLVLSRTYRMEAQNALLKILEEPPAHIVFILVAPSKTALLPTVRSRLPLEELNATYERIHSGLNLKRLDLGVVYSFVQTHHNLDKNSLKEMVQAIVYEAIHEHGLRFSERELEHFQKLVHLCELNTRAQTVLISLLLSILQRKYA